MTVQQNQHKRPNEDLSRFTISSSEEMQGKNIAGEKVDFHINPNEISDEGPFWGTERGRVWMFIFIACLAIAVLVGLMLLQVAN